MSNVRLVDLDVFKRYSLAIRQESAPVEEVLAVLDATRRQIELAMDLRRPPARPPEEVEPDDDGFDDGAYAAPGGGHGADEAFAPPPEASAPADEPDHFGAAGEELAGLGGDDLIAESPRAARRRPRRPGANGRDRSP